MVGQGRGETEDLDEDLEADVAVQVDVGGESLWSPIDTAALSIWVDRDWYLEKGGKVAYSQASAKAVDGSPLEVDGGGTLSFRLWV